MATKRTYINADEELVIKGQLTIEGNVTQIETTQQVTNLQGNVFTINSDGDNTPAILNLNSNGTLGSLTFTDGGNVAAEPGLQGNLFVASGQSIIIDGGGSIGGSGFTGNLTGTASNADALSSAVTLNLSGNATGSTSFINAGDSVTLPVNLVNSGVTAGTYGTSNDAAQITVDAQGRITTASDVAINHDALLNFVADEHIAHSSVTLTAGAGLTGGGDITSSRTFDIVGGTGITVTANDIQTDDSYIKGLLSASNGVDYNSSTGAFQAVESEIQHDSLDGFVADEHIAHSGVTLTAGTGLTGGGDITASRTFNVIGGNGITANADDIEIDTSVVVDISSTQTISGDKTFTGTVDLSGATVPGFTVDGELSVTGNVNSLNYVDLQVQNSEIILNSNVATAQDAVIKNERGSTGNDTYLKWDEASDRWQFSNDGSTDNDMLLLSDFSATSPITFSSGVIAINNPITEDFVFAGNLEVQGSLIVGPDAIEDIHKSFFVNTNGALTYTHNASGAYYAVAKGDGIVLTANTVAVGAGDGITVNANDVQVDSTVIRTTGNQSLAGVKTFTGELLLPTTDVTTENAIFTDSNEAWVYVNGSKKQITPTSSLGTAEQANSSFTYSLTGSTTGTSTYELYAGKRTIGVDDFHAIKGLEEGTYTSLSETATAVTIEADISAIRGAFSVTDTGGDGSLTYNSGTGVITYTGPSASQVRAHLSGSGLIGYNSGTGVISTSADNYGGWNFETDTSPSESVSSGNLVSILGGSGIDVTHSGKTITVTNTNSADITGVIAGSGLSGGGLSGTVTLDIGAGTGISVAADTISVDMSAFSTTNLIEGSNLYYTNARADARVNLQTGTNLDLSSKDTDELNEGSSNLYYTNSRADARVNLQTGTNLDLSSKDTDELNEGSSNLYFTNARARNAISVSGDLSYDSANGVISFTNDAGDIESVSITAGTGLTGTASASSGAFSTTLNVTGLTVSELAPTSLLTSSETFADSDTQLMTAKAIDDRIISKGYSTTTGTVTQVDGGSGLTGSVTTSGSLAVGAGNYILVGSNDVGVDATSTNTANKVVARDGSGNFAAGTITATATQAQYADLAENYEADSDYEPGTVLILGGVKEVTVTDEPGSFKAMGVVSTNPAHLMNVDCEGEHVVAVALRGRIPCKVAGTCKKGDVLITSDTPGHAMVAGDPKLLSPLQIIGRALEHKTSAAAGVVEIIV